MANLSENCVIMIDQIRAIDNKRLMKRVGVLPTELIEKMKENIAIILDLE
jgi:mRNA interferase MazF